MFSRQSAVDMLGRIRVSMFNNAYYNILKSEQSEERLKKSDFVAKRFIRHCIVVAIISEKLAENMNLNKDKAFIIGLLHDIGRFQHKRFHGLMGYKLFTEIFEKTGIEIFKDIARISLTHTLINSPIKESYSSFDIYRSNNPNNIDIINKDEQEVILERKKVTPDEYDYIVAMADLLATGDSLKPNSLKERLDDIFKRYYQNEEGVKNRWMFDELAKDKGQLEKHLESLANKKMIDMFAEIKEIPDSDYYILNDDNKYKILLGEDFEEKFIADFYKHIEEIIKK
ncbi:MAG TPA: HD domain-containing protein [Rickettsiales bacterium]|nr:HD domain-containing protein [Rickettsiales bacterium]